jgi:hypothetical protein
VAELVVEGYTGLMRALAQADRDVRLGVRRELRGVARPVQQDAQQLALSTIAGMPRSPRWAGMRIGIIRTSVYVAPRQRGVKSGPRKRPNLANLLMNQAMQPALDRNTARVEAGFEQMLDTIADKFNRG